MALLVWARLGCCSCCQLALLGGAWASGLPVFQLPPLARGESSPCAVPGLQCWPPTCPSTSGLGVKYSQIEANELPLTQETGYGTTQGPVSSGPPDSDTGAELAANPGVYSVSSDPVPPGLVQVAFYQPTRQAGSVVLAALHQQTGSKAAGPDLRSAQQRWLLQVLATCS